MSRQTRHTLTKLRKVRQHIAQFTQEEHDRRTHCLWELHCSFGKRPCHESGESDGPTELAENTMGLQLGDRLNDTQGATLWQSHCRLCGAAECGLEEEMAGNL